MFCTNCGKEIPDDSIFCTFCGQKVDGGAAPADAGSSVMSKLPKKISKKSATVAAAAAVVIVVGAVVMNVAASPKAAVAKGIQKTWKASCQKETGLNAYLGMNSLEKMLKDKSASQIVSGSVSARIFGTQAGDADFKVQLDTEKDEKLAVNAEGSIAGMDIGTISFYKDEKDVYAAATELLDGSFHVDLKDLEKKLNDRDYLESLWDDYKIYIAEGQDIDSKELSEKIAKTAKTDLKALYKNMEVKKTEKKSFSIGGKDKKCQGYDVTIKSDNIKQLIEDVSDVYIDECGYLNDYSYASDYDSKEEYVNEYKDTVRKEVKQLANAFKKDLNLQVYVGPGGRMVSIGAEGKIPATVMMDVFYENGNGTVEVSADFLGSKNPLDEMVISGEMQIANSGSCTVEVTRTLKDDKSSIDDSVEISLSAIDGSTNLSGSAELYGKVNKQNGKWEVGMEGSIPGVFNTSNVYAEGTFENVKKGKSFLVRVEDVNLTSLVGGLGAIDLDVSYEIAPLKGGISNSMSKGTVYDVLDLTEDDWNDIEKEISLNASAMGL